MSVGNTKTLTATPTPSGSTVTWSSSSNTIATVTSGGVVEGQAAGKATITASITVSGLTYTDACEVTVSA